MFKPRIESVGNRIITLPRPRRGDTIRLNAAETIHVCGDMFSITLRPGDTRTLEAFRPIRRSVTWFWRCA